MTMKMVWKGLSIEYADMTTYGSNEVQLATMGAVAVYELMEASVTGRGRDSVTVDVQLEPDEVQEIVKILRRRAYDVARQLTGVRLIGDP